MPPAPTTSHDQAGVTVKAPDQPGWSLVKAEEFETRFERSDAAEPAIASVRTLKIATFGRGSDLLRNMEAWKEKQLSKLERDSVHFNRVRFKGVGCLQYDGIFRDPSRSDRLAHLNVKGYLCPLPGNDQFVAELEVSSRSSRRGFSEELLAVSDEFFEATGFVEIKHPPR
jgi:hypothetical protein